MKNKNIIILVVALVAVLAIAQLSATRRKEVQQ